MRMPYVWMALHFKDLFSPVCQVALPHSMIGPREAGQHSECSYAKTPIATNDMNFLVFTINLCVISVRSLNWANSAFHMSYSAFLSGCSSTG